MTTDKNRTVINGLMAVSVFMEMAEELFPTLGADSDRNLFTRQIRTCMMIANFREYALAQFRHGISCTDNVQSCKDNPRCLEALSTILPLLEEEACS